MPEFTHRIRSLRWQARAATPEEGFALRSRCREEGMSVLLPALEQTFDRLPPDRVLRLPRLELSVRLGPGGEFPSDLQKVIAEQVMAQVRGSWMSWSASDPSSGELTQSREEASFLALNAYLESGNLPWEAVRNVSHDVVRELRETALANILRCVVMCAAPGGGPVRWFRFLQLLPAERLHLVVESVGPRAGSRTVELDLLRVLLEDGPRSLGRPLLLRLAAATALAAVRGDSLPPMEEVLTVAQRQELAGFASTLAPTLRHLLIPGDESGPAVALPDDIRRSLQRGEVEIAGTSMLFTEERRVGAPLEGAELQPLEHGLAGQKQVLVDRVRTEQVGPTGRFAGIEQQAEFPLGSAGEFTVGTSPPLKPEDELFPLLVRDAGLLLLSPFIARFFVQTGLLVEGDSSLQPDVLPRAAALLHHLVTDRDEPYEFDLGLIKVLLGLRPELPLLVDAGLLPDRDRQEATALLQSVIGHWRALKNTSVDGLRTSFLQRSGIMREVDNGWQLQVERRPFDILLEQLPWGFGIVKLPWMPRAIHTDW